MRRAYVTTRLRAVLVCSSWIAAGCVRHGAAPVLDPDLVGGADAPPACSDSEVRGTVASPDLDELSGLAASVRHPGALWAINDSGEPSLRLFALDTRGNLTGTFTVPELVPYDVEDLTVWHRPGETHDMLMAADIGDNVVREGGAGRKHIILYGVEEPSPAQLHASPETRLAFTLLLTYPDRPHDAEALFVDPRSGVLYVFAKETFGPSNFYRLAPPFGGGSRVLEMAGTLSVGTERFPGLMITAASIRPDGGMLAFRTYGSLVAFPRAAGASIESALGLPARILPLPGERQGESLTFATDGLGVFTVSEGVAPRLHYTSVQCASTAR
jgi:hypothetical protein